MIRRTQRYPLRCVRMQIVDLQRSWLGQGMKPTHGRDSRVVAVGRFRLGSICSSTQARSSGKRVLNEYIRHTTNKTTCQRRNCCSCTGSLESVSTRSSVLSSEGIRKLFLIFRVSLTVWAGRLTASAIAEGAKCHCGRCWDRLLHLGPVQ